MYGYVIGLPAFLGYFAVGMIAYCLFVAIYTRLTSHDEMALIRSGNSAAALAFLGALIGFSLPVASAAENSVSIVDFGIWAAIAIVIQIFAFFVARATLPGLEEKITQGDTAAGLWGGGIAVIIGMLNAACMTY